MKLGKGIHEIFVFYTPKLMDIYFQYLKNKFKKAVGVTTLLVQGSDLPNIHSESHMSDSSLMKIHPDIKLIQKQDAKLASEENQDENLKKAKVVDLDKQSKIKSFSKSQKVKQTQKSCIINRKAS